MQNPKPFFRNLTLSLLVSLIFNSPLPLDSSAARAADSQTATATLPSATDPQIKTFDIAHLSWLPQTKSRNQLVLFLPGTNGVPRSDFGFTKTAAALGFHTIFLMYPDGIAAQQCCVNRDDPDAYIKFRTAIIEGGFYSDQVNITRPDSIENRLQKLLSYLDKHQPKQGWGQYLDKSGQINWKQIVVCGHSQGGGHAYMISKYHQVARVICFSSPKDYSHYFRAPAKGFDNKTKTPLNRYFAFNHLQDKIGTHEEQMEIFKSIGLTREGMIEVNDPQSDYKHARLIFTNLAVIGSPKTAAHGSVLRDIYPLCPSVWKYMLTEPVQ